MGDLTINFSRCEFSCKCGCGYNQVAPELVKQIQLFRGLLWISADEEIPISISSGCRCSNYNAQIGGTKDSFHMKGMAADIFFKKIPVLTAGRTAYLANRLLIMTAGGIGVYPDSNFIHLDIRPGKLTTWINNNNFYNYGVNFA